MNKEIVQRDLIEYDGEYEVSAINNDFQELDQNTHFVLNDIYFPIPPLSITVQKENFNFNYKTLRTKASTKLASGRGIINIQLKLLFNAEMFLMLHRLIIQVQNNPFVYVKSNYIYESIFGTKLELNKRNLHCTVIGLRVSSFQAANNTFEVELDLRYFNYFPYSPNLLFKKDYESIVSVSNGKVTSNIFSVFPSRVDSHELIYALKNVEFEITSKPDTAQNKIFEQLSVENTIEIIQNKPKLNFNASSYTPAESAVFVRYYNYLQIKALYEDFGVAVGFKAKTEQNGGYDEIELNDKIKEGMETGFFDKGNFRFVIGLHSKYLPYETRKKLTKLMLEKEFNTKIYYNEYAHIQLKESILKKYRQEIMNGTEGIEEEETRNKIIKENQIKIANWLASSDTNNNFKYADGYTPKTEVVNYQQKINLPEVQSNERDIQYPIAADDFSITKRNGISYPEFIFEKQSSFYPITNKGYIKNGDFSRIYNSQVIQNDKASYGLFPIFCIENNLKISSFSTVDRNLVLDSDSLSISIIGITLLTDESGVFIFKDESLNKGDLLGFCEKEFIEIQVLKGEYYPIESSTKSLNTQKPDDQLYSYDKAITKSYGLKYLTDKDKDSFSEFNEYLRKASWFPYVDKEYVSNIFYKTRILKIENSSFEISKKNTNSDPEFGNFEISEIKSEALINVAAGINNLTASIPILGQDYPTTQYLSSTEPSYNFNYVAKTRTNENSKELSGLPETILEFERIRNVLAKNAREYKFIPDGGFFLIDSLMTRLFGTFKEKYIIADRTVNYSSFRLLKPLVIDSFENRTLDSFPGASSFTMRLSETAVYNPEEIKEVLTNKKKDNNKFFEEIYQNILDEYCGENGELILTSIPETKPSKPAIQNLNSEYKPFEWSSKYFSYRDHYRNENIEECKSFLSTLPGIDYLAYLCYTSFLDVIVDFYKFICKKANTNEPKIVVISGYDNPSKPGSRTTISDHYFGSAMDIKAIGRNAQELHLIVELMYRLGIVDNPTKPGLKGNTLGGLGIYGKKIITNNENMSSTNKYGGFVHIDLNVKKGNNSTIEEIKSLDKSKKRAAVVDAFKSNLLNGASMNPEDYKFNEERRFSGYDDDKIEGIINPTPRAQYWGSDSHNNYKSSEFDNYQIDNLNVSTKEQAFTDLLLEFKNETHKPDAEVEASFLSEEEDDIGSNNKSVSKRLDLELKKGPAREGALLNQDAGANIFADDWESIIENKFKGIVWSSDYVYGKDIVNADSWFSGSDYDNNLKTKVANQLFKASNSTITNDTLVKRFSISANNFQISTPGDPNLSNANGYDHILDIEAYLKEQGLTFIITNSDGEPVDLKDPAQNQAGSSAYQIFVADPGAGFKTEHVSEKYIKGELASLIDMICNFDKFASLLLIEPDMYLEEITPISIKTEYERIEKALYNVKIVCSYFSNLEFGVFGILNRSGKTIEDILDSNVDNSFLNKHLGRDFSASRITTTLVTAGFFLYEVSVLTIAGLAAITTSAAGTASTGGLGVGPAIIAGLSIIGAAHYLIDETRSLIQSSNNSISMPSDLANSFSNIFRALNFVIQDFNKRTSGYKNSDVFKNIADRQFNLFKEIYSKIELKNKIGFSGKTRENILTNTEGADTIVQACFDIHEVFTEKNPIVLKYMDAAASLQTHSQLDRLIRSDFIEKNTTVKRFSFSSNGFDSGLGTEYLTYLLYFPKAVEFDGFGYDALSFNEVDFDDLFEWKNEDQISGVALKQARNKFDRGTDQSKYYSIDEQMIPFTAQNRAIDSESVFSFSKVEEDKIGSNRWIYHNRKKLKQEQEKRIVYLKTLLEETIKALYSFPEFRNTITNQVDGFDEEFDFSGTNAYPDIDLPMDPFDPNMNTNMNPGFFYYESEYDNNIFQLKDKIKKRSEQIMDASLAFVSDLRNGLFVGGKNILESKDMNAIKDFILKDQQEGSNDISHILEGNVGDVKKLIGQSLTKNQLDSLKQTATITITNSNDENSNEAFANSSSKMNGLDALSAELMVSESINNLNTVANPAAHLSNINDQIKKSMNGTMEAFGSSLGFNKESFETLKLFQQASSDSNLNSYLGLLGDNSNYLEDNNLKQILNKSGENLIKKQYDMKKAYPTFKFYLIEEDAVDSDNLFVFDDFYSFNSVKDFTIHKSRRLSGDTAVIRLQNVSGTLDGSKIGMLRDIDYDIAQTKEIKVIGQSPAYEKVESIVLRPGVSCQLRAGYNSNPKDLTILLSGKIADVAWSSNGDMCEITVQSFGVELETKRYGMTKEDPVAQINFNTTHKLLSYLLFRPELKHFGRFKKNRRFQYGESKAVVIAKENYLGNTQGLTFAQSILEYAGSTTFAFILFAVTASIFKVRQLRALGSSDEALNLLDNAGRAGKNATAEVLSEASQAAGTLNVARQAAVVEQVAQSSGIFGKIFNFIFKRGWGRGTKLADDVLEEVNKAGNARPVSSGIDDVANTVNETLAASTSNNRIVNAILNLLNSFTNIVFNVSKGGKLIDVLDNVGDTSSLLRKLTTMNATTTAVVSRAFAQKSWVGAYFGALTNGISLGIWSSVKFQATAFLLGKTAEWLLQGLIAIKDGVFEGLKALVLDTFNPSLDQIILSPQDDSLYCPHPDKYIKPKAYKGFFSSLISEIGNTLYVIAKLGWDTGVGWLMNSDDITQQNLLKMKSLMMDRRLHAKDGENVYNISGNTIWEIFHEMSLRHPGWVYGARQYGSGLEYRMFFGLPSQRYFANPISPSKAIRLNEIWEIASTDQVTIEKLESLLGTKKLNDFRSNIKEDKEDKILKEYCKQVLFEEWNRTTNKRFIPFRSFHLLSSDFNIVANNISGMNDVINEVGVMYNEAPVNEEPKWVLRTVRAHENIPEEQIHSKPIRYANLKGNSAALRYAIGELANSAKEMYRGEIITLGNPDINPYDICILDDKCNEMFGPIEVEAVTHMFNFETGFLTEIKPNALVTANEGITFPMLNSVIMYDIGMHIAQKEHHSLKYDSERFDQVIDDQIDDWLNNIDLFEFPIFDKVTMNKDLTDLFEQVKNGNATKDAKFKSLLKQQIKDMFLNNNAVFQSEILNENASVDGLINTSGITAALGSVPATATLLQLIKTRGTSFSNLKNPTVMFFTALTALSFAAKDVLNYQLSTPGSFIANKLLPGDMLVSPVTDGNLIQIYPLFKNNKPMVYSGYDKLSLKNNISNKLGNIYNSLSDAAFSINSMLMEYSNVNGILNNSSQISTSKEYALNGLQELLPFNLPNGAIKGYYTSYKDSSLETLMQQTTK